MQMRLMAALAIALAVAGVTPVLNAATYNFTDVGSYGSGTTTVSGVNASGQVIGVSYKPVNYMVGVIYSPNTTGSTQPTPVSIGSFNGTKSSATAINSSGVVVGNSAQAPDDDGVTTMAVKYSGGALTPLGSLGGSSFATAINASGQIVGYSILTGGTGQHAVVYTSGGPMDLGTFTGATSSVSQATGINGSGQVVGSSYSSDGQYHAFLTSATGTVATGIDLGEITGISNSFATAINDNGEVVGYAGFGGTKAFYWTSKTSLVPLSYLGSATTATASAIDSNGDIVGYSGGHAVIWIPNADGTYGLPTDLNSLVSLPTGVTLTTATGINDNGEIVGIFTNAGSTAITHGYALTLSAAVPEPASLGLIAIGAPLLMRRRRTIA